MLSAWYFGNSTQQLVTFNWSTFTAREGGWGGSVDNRPAIAIIVQLIVMLFPVFDMLSVFPLVAVTLGNNIYNVLPQGIIYTTLHTSSQGFKASVRPKVGVISARLLAAIPPIIAAAVFGEISKIFAIAGIFSFWPVLIWPPVLYLLSR